MQAAASSLRQPLAEDQPEHCVHWANLQDARKEWDGEEHKANKASFMLPTAQEDSLASGEPPAASPGQLSG